MAGLAWSATIGYSVPSDDHDSGRELLLSGCSEMQQDGRGRRRRKSAQNRSGKRTGVHASALESAPRRGATEGVMGGLQGAVQISQVPGQRSGW